MQLNLRTLRGQTLFLVQVLNLLPCSCNRHQTSANQETPEKKPSPVTIPSSTTRSQCCLGPQQSCRYGLLEHSLLLADPCSLQKECLSQQHKKPPWDMYHYPSSLFVPLSAR